MAKTLKKNNAHLEVQLYSTNFHKFIKQMGISTINAFSVMRKMLKNKI